MNRETPLWSIAILVLLLAFVFIAADYPLEYAVANLILLISTFGTGISTHKEALR